MTTTSATEDFVMGIFLHFWTLWWTLSSELLQSLQMRDLIHVNKQSIYE